LFQGLFNIFRVSDSLDPPKSEFGGPFFMTDPVGSRYIGRLMLGAVLLLLPLSISCGDSGGNGDPDPDPPVPDSIALNPASLSFDAIGDTARATATVLDQYGDVMLEVAVVWASDNATVAIVDQTGLVTSVRDGETTIRAQGGTIRGSMEVEVTQEPHLLESLEGNNQFQWTGFPLETLLKVRLTDGAGTAVVGREVDWEVEAGDGTVFPEAEETDEDGEVSAAWVLGPGESGPQRASATVADLDPVYFDATGSAPLTLLNGAPLTGPMLDTLEAVLLTSDSLGVPEKGISIEFRDISGFGEIAQGPTTSDINGELKAGWILGPTPGPQELTAFRTDIGAELPLTATATGVLDPWPFEVVAPGFVHTCAVDNTSEALCWGGNEQSQLATEDTLPVENPLAIPTTATWSHIGAGEFHTCGLSTGGSTLCWGQGWQTGQAWDSISFVTAPTAVAGGGFQSLTVGAYHNCGLKADGTAWCWGDESEGRLGNGTLVPTHVPTAVEGGLTWTRLSAGHFHTCGITENGDAYCWGRGQYGRLGDGGLDDRTAPALVANGYQWVDISAGHFHSCGIIDTGQAFCWGRGQEGQLGNGSNNVASPQIVAGGHTWTDIAAGWVHSCGVDTNKKLYCWGQRGFIGVGPFGSSTPVVVLPAYNWRSVHTKGTHTCAVTIGRETYCWGPNDFGQLGVGNTRDLDIPRILVRGVLEP
jgi:alpha-tubulin suppressor-like RCC1 family protein